MPSGGLWCLEGMTEKDSHSQSQIYQFDAVCSFENLLISFVQEFSQMSTYFQCTLCTSSVRILELTCFVIMYVVVQIVMYPIINLKYHKMGLRWYLRALSATFAIDASRVDGLTGVQVGMACNSSSNDGWFMFYTCKFAYN